MIATNENNPVVIGLDIGTSGVKAVAVSPIDSAVLARSKSAITSATYGKESRLHEQDPDIWWSSSLNAINELLHKLKNLGIAKERLIGVACDGTSGTLVCVDLYGDPVRSAMMYDDARSEKEAEKLVITQAAHCSKLGYKFSSSFSICKILWLIANEPESYEKTRWFMSPADFVVSRMTGQLGITDYTNALKMGYDLVEDKWPSWVRDYSGLSERLPNVVAPGTQTGMVQTRSSRMSYLPEGLPVLAGATDSTAAFLASGATRVGDENSTLGSTLVVKRLCSCIIGDRDGRCYSHKLPDNRWLLGAASNVGAAWIREDFPEIELTKGSNENAWHLPTDNIAYPLTGVGERFPFRVPSATSFCTPPAENRQEEFAANLQGLAFAERLGYEIISEITGISSGYLHVTGAASQNNRWVQIRSDIQSRVVRRPLNYGSDYGAAIIAATDLYHGDLWEAARSMVVVRDEFVPNQDLADQYNDRYVRFVEALHQRGYI